MMVADEEALRPRSTDTGSMSAILFVDVETTGLAEPPRDGTPTRWPRAVSVAWGLARSRSGVQRLRYFVVRPEGFVIPADATAVHGISQSEAMREGVPIAEVLEAFSQDVSAFRPRQMVAHNLQFDRRVLAAEYERLGSEAPFENMTFYCTMLKTTRLCAIPGSRGGYKWPRLGELHERLLGQPIRGAHNALADVCTTIRIYHELSHRGHIEQATPLLSLGEIDNLMDPWKGASGV